MTERTNAHTEGHRFAGSDNHCNDDEQGHVELAISKPKGAGCETPNSEPGYSITDQVL